MIRAISLLLSSLFVVQALAKSTSYYTSIYFPAASGAEFEASVIASVPDLTTYAIFCTNWTECGLAGYYTVAQGPSTASWTLSTTDYQLQLQCQLHGTTSQVCTESFGGYSANFPGIDTSTYTGDDAVLQRVLVTEVPDAKGSSIAASTTGISTRASTGQAGSTALGLSATRTTLSGTGTARSTGTSSASGNAGVKPTGGPGVAAAAALALGLMAI